MDKKHIEALLFVAKEPLTIEYITKLLAEEDETIDENTVQRWMFEFINEYKERGIRIRQVAGGFEMVSADECYSTIEKLLPVQYERLPRSAFETLAAVIVKQPATRAIIAKFRDVKNPDDAIQKVVERKFIQQTEEGYVTTNAFLKAFGINDLKQLKELKEQLKSLDKHSDVEPIPAKTVEEVEDLLDTISDEEENR